MLGLILAVWLCVFLAENFFFDKLFYKKSRLFGYNYVLFENWTQRPQTDNQRIADLKLLLDQLENPTIVNFCGAPDLNLIRQRVYTQTKPLVVVVIGDSVTFGVGVKIKHRFSALLETKLNHLVPTKVYTLAEPGNSFEADYALYQLARDYLNPDLVIFGLDGNDLIQSNVYYPNAKNLRSSLKSVCSQPDLKLGYKDLPTNFEEVLAIYQQTFLPQYSNRCFLKTLAAELGRVKNNLFFNFFDFELAQSSRNIDHAISFRRAIMDPYKSDLKFFKNEVIGYTPEKIYDPVSEAEGHPSAAVHQEFAEIIFAKILANLRL